MVPAGRRRDGWRLANMGDGWWLGKLVKKRDGNGWRLLNIHFYG